MSTHRSLAATLAVSAALLLTCACSDDDGGSKADTSVQDDARAGDAGADGPAPDAKVATGTLEVTVYASEDPVDTTSGRAVAAGVDVRAILPGGRSVEKKTDASGVVTFDAVDWSAGTAALTAYKAGYSIASQVGLTEQTSKTRLELLKLRSAPTTVKISGAPKNIDSAARGLIVTHDQGSGSGYRVAGVTPTGFNVEAVSGQPFTLVGVAFTEAQAPPTQRSRSATVYGWTSAKSSGATADATLDLDFATKLTPKAFSGTLVLPDAKSVAASASFASVRVTTVDSLFSLVVGLHTKTTLSSDSKQFAFDAEYVDLPEAKNLLVQYQLIVGGGAMSVVAQRGAPTTGVKVDGFLDVPIVSAPVANASALSRYVFKTLEDKRFALISLQPAAGGEVVWRTFVPAGVTSAAVPPPPASADVAKLLGRGALRANVGHCSDVDQTKSHICGKFSVSTNLTVTAAGERIGLVNDRALKSIEGAEVCIEDDSAVACAKTDANGLYKLQDVLRTKESTMVLKASGKLDLRVPVSPYPNERGYDVLMFSAAEVDDYYKVTGKTKKAGTGAVLALLYDQKGSKIALVGGGGDGPYYFKDSSADIDPAATSSNSDGSALFLNVPAGVQTFEFVAANGKPCRPVSAWGMPGQRFFRADVKADTWTMITVRCE